MAGDSVSTMWMTVTSGLNVSSSADISASYHLMYPARLIATCSAAAYASIGSLLSAAAAAAVVIECRRRQSVKPVDVYLFSILLSDFLQTSVYMSTSVASGILRRDVLGHAGCVFMFWLHVTCHGTTLLSHACLAGHWMILSLDSGGRAIRKLGTGAAVVAASLSWLVVGVTSVAVAVDATYNGAPDYVCSHDFNTVTSYTYAAVSLFPSLVLAPIGYVVTLRRIHRLHSLAKEPSGFAAATAVVGAGRHRVENGGDGTGRGVELGDLAERIAYELRIARALVVAFAALETLFVSGIVIKSAAASYNAEVDSVAETLMHTMFVSTSFAIVTLSSDHRRALCGTARLSLCSSDASRNVVASS